MKNKIKNLFTIIITFALICVATLWIFKNFIYPRKYKDHVDQAAKIYNVDPNLVYAIIKQESKFNKDAVSSSGAKGLMQLMKPTAKEFARKIEAIDSKKFDLFDPYTNIQLGTKYISYLINYYDGNYYLAIIAYNAGIGKVSEWLEDTNYSKYNDYDLVSKIVQYNETKNYFYNVIKNYTNYTNLYN